MPPDPNGVRSLAAALIEGALKDLRTGGAGATNARTWIDGGRARVSFSVACDVCDLDPDAIRSRLRRMAA